MTGLNWRTIATATIASFGIFIGATAAQAHEGERWEHERWEHRHHYEGRWHHEGPRVVYERQPVYVAPAPVYVAPMYQAPAPSGLNLNFNIPLQ
jgi:hypothetical protein